VASALTDENAYAAVFEPKVEEAEDGQKAESTKIEEEK